MNLLVNRRAKFDYEILETFESGIVLTGKEVKSLKNKRGKLEGSYGVIYQNEISIINFDIPVYQPKNTMGLSESDRSRKILLHKKEIKYLIGKLKERNLTLIPLRVYLKRKKIKLELALAKGKTKIDKRETIKKRDVERDMRREIK